MWKKISRRSLAETRSGLHKASGRLQSKGGVWKQRPATVDGIRSVSLASPHTHTSFCLNRIPVVHLSYLICLSESCVSIPDKLTFDRFTTFEAFANNVFVALVKIFITKVSASEASLMSGYAKCSREQLLQLLHLRDDEIVSLKSMNREVNSRLSDVNAQLHAFADRFAKLDLHDASLRERVAEADDNVKRLQSRFDHMANHKIALERRIVELQELLEHEMIWRKGFFPSLGLKVQDATAGRVEVEDVRDPARSSGIEPGDTLSLVSVSLHNRIRTVADYQKVIADLPPEATVSVEVIRRGKSFVVQLQPVILPYRNPASDYQSPPRR